MRAPRLGQPQLSRAAPRGAAWYGRAHPDLASFARTVLGGIVTATTLGVSSCLSGVRPFLWGRGGFVRDHQGNSVGARVSGVCARMTRPACCGAKTPKASGVGVRASAAASGVGWASAAAAASGARRRRVVCRQNVRRRPVKEVLTKMGREPFR